MCLYALCTVIYLERNTETQDVDMILITDSETVVIIELTPTLHMYSLSLLKVHLETS